MPFTMQNKSAQSNHPELRNAKMCSDLAVLPMLTVSNILTHIESFSAGGFRIELTHFALCQESQGTS